MSSRFFLSSMVAVLCLWNGFTPTEAKAVQVDVHVHPGGSYGHGSYGRGVYVAERDHKRHGHWKYKYRRVWVPPHHVWRNHHRIFIPGHYERVRVRYH